MDRTGPEGERRIRELLDEQAQLERERAALHGFLAAIRSLAAAIDAPAGEYDVLDLLEQVLDSALRAVDAENGSLLVPDERHGGLVFALVRGEHAAARLTGTRIPPGEGIANWVARHRRAAIVNDVASDERFYPEVDRQLAHRTRSVLAAPLTGGGHLLAVIELVNRRGGKLFSLANQTLISLMCRFAGELLNGLLKDLDLSQTIEQAVQARAATVHHDGPPR